VDILEFINRVLVKAEPCIFSDAGKRLFVRVCSSLKY
jgi:hypothetical protein